MNYPDFCFFLACDVSSFNSLFLLFSSSAVLERLWPRRPEALPRSAYADGVKYFGGPKMLIFLCNLSDPACATIGENDAHREICG